MKRKILTVFFLLSIYLESPIQASTLSLGISPSSFLDASPTEVKLKRISVFRTSQLSKEIKITNYKDALDTGLIGDILYKVISRKGKSKDYPDLLRLDGGTVGIAHFAVGGLADLYQYMDTEKYFGKSKKDMIDNYSSRCRPPGKSGDDNDGWGCFSKAWWRQGMKKFLTSTDSKKIQNDAWSSKMKPVIEKSISKGWNTQRQIAIALGIANSIGSDGFNNLASKNNWDSEKTLKSYVGSDEHRKRRRDAINENFPILK